MNPIDVMLIFGEHSVHSRLSSNKTFYQRSIHGVWPWKAYQTFRPGWDAAKPSGKARYRLTHLQMKMDTLPCWHIHSIRTNTTPHDTTACSFCSSPTTKFNFTVYIQWIYREIWCETSTQILFARFFGIQRMKFDVETTKWMSTHFYF